MKKRGHKLFRKGVYYLGELSFFSPAVFLVQYEQIPNKKEKNIVRISCLATLLSIF